MLTTDDPPDAHDRNGRELNATKHGILSRHAVLPWEDRAEFDALLASLVGEHGPEGPTEHHLVEEIAAVMWRKQRVLLAEAASHRAGLQRRLEWDHSGLVRRAVPHARAHPVLEGEVRSAVALSPGEDEAELEQLGANEAGIRAAIEILEDDGPHAHEEALAALTWEVREGWEEAVLEERLSEGPSLLSYLREVALDWIRAQRREIEDKAQVRSQALGEAVDLERLERVARYETHLDRKLGRSLSMLMKLQELRRTIAAPAA